MPEEMIIIDGNSLMHRAFYALPPMTNSKGKPTGALYGFFNMLIHIVEQYQPDYLAVAFDKHGKTFRHEWYAEYKAGRRKTPPELIEQFPMLKESLRTLHIAVFEQDGMEADDFLGSISKKAEKEGIFSYLLTGDKDALQLIDDQTSVLLTRKGVTEIEVYDKKKLWETYGLEPWQIVELKALMGDSSDHIPGVPGVGEKTALKLLSQYPSIEQLYENIDHLPANKLREKLVQNKESAFLSQKLATINREVELGEWIESCRFDGQFDQGALQKVLSELEFRSMMKRLGIEDVEDIQAETQEISTIEEWKNIIAKMDSAKPLAIYISGPDCYLAQEESKEYHIVTEQSLLIQECSPETVLREMQPLLQEGRKLIFHDYKTVRKYVGEWGIETPLCDFDVMLAEYVLNPTQRNYSLEKLRTKYGAAGNAAAMLTIAKKQKEKIEELQLHKILDEIERPLTDVLYHMEKEGFRIDVGTLKELGEEYQQRLAELTQEIYQLAGSEFNISSTKQLGVVLFETLGLPVQKKTKTGYSTDIEVLEKLEDQHPIIPFIIEYRLISKLKSTYIDGLLAIVDRNTGKIHTTFNQVATATGRISSVEPNLQNIPVRTEKTRDIRKAFIPSEPGRKIVSADYSQIELRVLAAIADDEHMKDAFTKGEDIHARTAAQVFGVPLDEVTSEMRSSAKAVNFGIVYGISDFGLAKNLHISVHKAADYIQRYLEEFSGVRNYMNEIVESAKEKGYVKTLWGRIRFVDELRSSNFNTRSFGKRVAMNTPIQGTAADIIKYAMILVAKAFEEKNLSSKLILQVHDELIVDAVPEEISVVEDILRDCMEHACKLSVPLKINLSIGDNWAEAK